MPKRNLTLRLDEDVIRKARVLAAGRSGVPRILSEDLQAGPTIEGILIMNPFD